MKTTEFYNPLYARKTRHLSVRFLGATNTKPSDNCLGSIFADLKRAKADKRFRRNYIARLKRRYEKLYTVPAELDALQTYKDNLLNLTREAEKIRKTLADIGAKTPKVNDPLDQAVVIPIDERTARELKVKLDMRGKDAKIKPCIGHSRLYYEAPVTEWRNGKAVGYTRAVRINYVQSFGIIDSDGNLQARIDGQDYSFPPPDGLRWEIDEHGLRVVAPDGAAYHIEAYHLVGWTLQQLREAVDHNREIRQAEEARLKAEALELEGVYVCFNDSRRAGNCAAGTRSWAEAHGLDVTRHYPASRLIPLAVNGLAQVRIALHAAARRHRKEMEQGYCELHKHKDLIL